MKTQLTSPADTVLCLHAFVYSFRHPWISPHVSLLGCTPHPKKGQLMCGDLKRFAQGQERWSWGLKPSLLKARQYLSHKATTPLTLAAFAAGWLCRAEPRLTEVSGSPLTVFQQALDQSRCVHFSCTPERICSLYLSQLCVREAVGLEIRVGCFTLSGPLATLWKQW